MGSRSHALFLDLLDDLSPILDPETRSLISSGSKVKAWPDISPKEYAALSLANSFYKKFVDEVDIKADQHALDKFLSVNERCGTWRLNLQSSWDEVLLGQLKQVVWEFLNPAGMPLVPSFDTLWSNLRCGPGASVDSPSYDFYSKLFSSRLTTTSEMIYRSYRSYTENFPEWANAELIRHAHYGDARVVEGNRLRFVPKTRDISRVICVEPTLNMCAELGMCHVLEDRLKTFFGIDLGRQPEINRELSRRGSLDQSFCTIDLESASDSLSLPMLREVLPRDFLAWLLSLRSKFSELPDGRKVKLEMVSTMGNGFTFPLQTFLFASVVLASARARGFNLERPRADSDGTFGVFGDDIILPTNCHYIDRTHEFVNYSDTLSRDVVRLLTLLGFVVNNEKSFFEGPFRESCGADFFRGRPVRGVYVKTLRTTQDRFVAINLLNRWSATTGIRLHAVVSTLLRSVPFTPVPIWEQDDSGVKVPMSLLQRYKVCKHTQSILYRKWVNSPRYLRIGDGEIFGNKRVIYNPSGLLIAFLNGTIRSCKIGIRSGVNIYKNRFGIASNWDVGLSGENAGMVPTHSVGGLPWRMAVEANIG